ncbi:MAG: C4-dicarboxylate ABC transporter substrate-binding protein [Desulfobacteraceae bacterium 4572_130]|nr:MAG: C4-dicarboxylate ABC transporter substrate-binding protein [Desulfobacteraceae bacterium 4572_130]
MSKRFMIRAGLLIIFFVFCFTTIVSGKTIKLTYSNFFPPTHIQSILAQKWCNEVEKRTNGKVKVEYYPGQTLTKADQAYDGVVEGLSDIALSCLAYSRGRFPVLGAVDLPMGYTSGVSATKVANRVLNNFNPKEFNDTKIMYLHAHGPGLVHTKNKPVEKIEDIKGLKLRSHGTSAKIVKTLGGTPVGLPMPETYQSIQKGIVDGSVYPFESNKGWKLGEVTDYATAAFSCAYTTTFFVAMNKDKWNLLSKNIQEIIENINKEWQLKHGQAWDDSDFIGIKFFLNQGNKIIGLNKKESLKWEKAVQPIINDYIAILNKKKLNGKKIINFIKNEVKK